MGVVAENIFLSPDSPTADVAIAPNINDSQLDRNKTYTVDIQPAGQKCSRPFEVGHSLSTLAWSHLDQAFLTTARIQWTGHTSEQILRGTPVARVVLMGESGGEVSRHTATVAEMNALSSDQTLGGGRRIQRDLAGLQPKLV